MAENAWACSASTRRSLCTNQAMTTLLLPDARAGWSRRGLQQPESVNPANVCGQGTSES